MKSLMNSVSVAEIDLIDLNDFVEEACRQNEDKSYGGNAEKLVQMCEEKEWGSFKIEGPAALPKSSLYHQPDDGILEHASGLSDTLSAPSCSAN